MPACWMLAGLGWIGGGDGGDGGDGGWWLLDGRRWEEGTGRNSHILELQEIGGLGKQRCTKFTAHLETHWMQHKAGTSGFSTGHAFTHPMTPVRQEALSHGST
jgi:hypothetical protein